MLISYQELRKVDVLEHCDFREAKDDKGNKIKVPYLNWAKCMDLLYKHGAEKVWWEPCVGPNGSSLVMSDQVFRDKNGVENRCYEVRVKITVDNDTWESQFPLMNGSNPVKDNSMTQQRLWNAQTRAFVKGVAMRTGLGFGLWVDEDMEPTDQPEDLSKHSIFAIKERMQICYTNLIRKGMTTKEIAQGLGMTEDLVRVTFTYFDQLAEMEKRMVQLWQNG